MTNQFFPFGLAPGSNPAQSFPYDVIINEEDPGLILYPTEANGVYVAFREVGGNSWWALNADYNTDAGNWEQVSPCNAALPAYAMVQGSDGSVTRYTAVATNTPGTAVSWTPVWSLDTKGNLTSEPLTGTATNQIASTIDVIWNAGSPAIMNIRKINLTDTSSNASSLVDNILVNGTPVWQVRKDGTLLTGIVPWARISGAPDFFNNPTFTGTATFTGPAVFEGSVNMHAGLTVAGGIGTDTLNVSGAAVVGGHLTVDTGLTVTGGETTDTLHVTGNASIDGTATIHNLTVTGTTTSTGGPLVSIESTDSSVSVTTPSSNTYNLEVVPPKITGVSQFMFSGTTTPGISNPQTFNMTVPSNVPSGGANVKVTISSPDSGTTFSGTITGGGFSTIPAYGVFSGVQSCVKSAVCSASTAIVVTVNSTPNPATQYITVTAEFSPL